MSVITTIDEYAYIWFSGYMFFVLFTLLYTYGVETNRRKNTHYNKASDKITLFYFSFIIGLISISARFFEHIYACSEQFIYNVYKPNNINADQEHGLLMNSNDFNRLSECTITCIKHREKRSKYVNQDEINIRRFTVDEIMEKLIHLSNNKKNNLK